MTIFWMPRILLKKLFFGILVLLENKKVNKVKIKIHNNNEPSWFPQRPEILYIIGFVVWELFTIRFNENSELIKPYSKIKKDVRTNTKFKFEIFLIINKFFSLKLNIFNPKGKKAQNEKNNAKINSKCPNS